MVQLCQSDTQKSSGELPSLLDEALRLADLGWAVLPCKSDKAPVCVRGLKDASRDVFELDVLFSRPEAKAIGIVIPAGVIALDLDKHGNLDGLAALNALAPPGEEIDPSTWPGPAAATPSSGAHLLARDPRREDKRGNGRGRLPAGVDVRAGGKGYVVAPDGTGQDGRRWLRPLVRPEDLPPLPRWIAELLVEPERPAASSPPTPRPAAAAGDDRRREAYAKAALDGAEQEVASAPQGERNTTLNRAALGLGHLVGGGVLAEQEAVEALLHGAIACGLPEQEARKTIASGLAAGAKEPRGLPPASEQQHHVGGVPVCDAPPPPSDDDAPPDLEGMRPDATPPPRAGATSTTSCEPWPEPQPLRPEHEPVPDLPPELLPQPLRDYCEDVAGRTCVPLGMVAIPSMIALGAVVGRKVCIQPEPASQWIVVPNLWGAIVAPPGTLKSAMLDAGLAPLEPLIRAADELHYDAARAVEAKRLAVEAKLTAAKRKGADSSAFASLLQEREELRAVHRRYVVSDVTLERLQLILADNPNGVLLARDELYGFFRMFDKPGHESDRQAYLELWNGDARIAVDRVSRAGVRINGGCLSLVGAIQPARIRAYVAEATSPDGGGDGLLQRLSLLVWPDRLPEWRQPTGERNIKAQETVFNLFKYLDVGASEHFGAARDGDSLPHVRFDSEAQELFTAWRDELERRVRAPEAETMPAYMAHVAKFRRVMPALSLLLHLAEGRRGAIGLDHARRGAAWVDFLEAHARKLYHVELSPGTSAAHVLATKIRSGLVYDGLTIRDMKQAEWGGLRGSDAVETAVAELAALGWVRTSTMKSAGRPSRVIEINPHVRRDDR